VWIKNVQKADLSCLWRKSDLPIIFVVSRKF
jgi:hypothetical protein